jgi:hypothetical protein
MRKHDLQGLLVAAQSRVRGVRALLARPLACNPDECITLIREAQGYLEWLRDSLPLAGPAAAPELHRQATALAGEIGQAGALLQQAARFGRRWLDRLRAMNPEYTSSGATVPLRIRGQISYLG